MVRVMLVCALACLLACGTHGEDNNAAPKEDSTNLVASQATPPTALPATDAPAAAPATPAAQPADAQPAAGDASGFLSSLGPAGAAIAAVQAQQQFSSIFGKTFLNLHIAVTWSQIASSWASQTLRDSRSGDNSFRAFGFEETADDASFSDDTTKFLDNVLRSAPVSRNLEEAFPYSLVKQNQDDNSKKGEVQGEQQVLYLTKLWHITAAYKLSEVQKTHYQAKIQLMMLQSLGNANPTISSLTYLIYYRDILSTISSAVTIQKQDAWSSWALLDLLETTTSAENDPAFLKRLVAAQHNAMRLWNLEASLDMQMMYIDFFVQSIVARLSAPGPAPQGSVSMLEEEAMAQPEKPFFPFLFGQGNPMVFAQYFTYLRLYSKFLLVQATQSMQWSAYLDETSTTATSGADKATQYAKYSVEVFARVGLPALSSWAQINLMLAYMEMFQMYSGLYQQRRLAAAASGHTA